MWIRLKFALDWMDLSSNPVQSNPIRSLAVFLVGAESDRHSSVYSRTQTATLTMALPFRVFRPEWLHQAPFSPDYKPLSCGPCGVGWLPAIHTVMFLPSQ